ncbi:hypothetical protein DI392_14500 [Vibrio albus]|uniref:PEGA domain-containing protein n=1 Tax=Vibrio albus TaxID=2200953 RepID=A0A2U3B7B8_9VIBR|nr:SUMF1/EgtB/PvdO family nonheme iron enzyme [Vibrio albus]PWI32624.1 hypothetical protein DI392_14500 [Vibrio albus]
MRQGLPALLIALTPCLALAPSMAADTPVDKTPQENISTPVETVQRIDDALFTQRTEMEKASRKVADKKASIRLAQENQNRLEKVAEQLDQKLAQAQKVLDRDYSRILNEPDFDIRPSQGAYQNAWADVKKNQQERLEAEQDLQEMYADLTQRETKLKHIKTELETLEQHKRRTRAERLRGELTQQKQLKVSFTNTCKPNMTLGQCREQTKNLAMQKAVGQFQDELISDTTESKLIKQHLGNTSLNIHVVGHNTSVSKFYDQNKHQTVLNMTLEARPAKNTPCKLLNIGSQYCFDEGTKSAEEGQQKEVQWVTLTIRSNQYKDLVSIDGVNYGNTPVDVMLPVGPHMVTVQKEGYRSFHQELKIDSDHTLRAILRETQNLPHSGKVFADALNSKAKAPEMVVIGAGEYLTREHAAKLVTVSDAYALSATPITVSQFEMFVNNTGYQTDAELQKLCTTVNDSQVIPVKDSYWRNPGFRQSSDSPAVCISQNDAKAYVKWLSRETGFNYRLPSEDEWEIGARAGTKTTYWWGNQFGTGNANTGWGGTKWSNVSTSPVKSFPANSFGLYDIAGNVWEWTSDARGVTKGGAWSFSPNQAAAESRLFLDPNTASNYVGFRILREL